MSGTQPTERAAVVLRDGGVTWLVALAGDIRKLGLTPLLVSGPADPADWRRLTDAYQRAVRIDDPTDAAQVVAAAKTVAGGAELAGIVTGSDGVVVTAAEASALLGLAGPDPAALARTRNKYAARRTLAAAGLPTPRFALLESVDAVARVAAEVGFPAIVKPLNGTASHGVRRVDGPAELAEAYRQLTDRLPEAMDGLYRRPLPAADGPLDPTRVLLVEAVLQGREYCVDVVLRDGAPEPAALVDKFLVDERFFEQGFLWPAELPEPGREALLRAAVAAVTALGLDQTVAHVELIDDVRHGPTIIEVNPGRPGGQLLPRLNELVTGIDLTAEYLALHLNLPRPRRQPAALPMPLATLTVFGHGTGRVVAVHGLAELHDLPDVIDVVTAIEPGYVLTGEHEVFAVNVLVDAADGAQAVRELYATVSELVHLELEPVDG
ncbi:ATP-grasp domain-containing protein [Micromonospora sp. NPDC047074]|uniref:ATP-grasp domain-containing protein n=1 Tax=Micromonospora sp. NPDC047074 TaxID=3154339 RepID=UPI0033FD75FD